MRPREGRGAGPRGGRRALAATAAAAATTAGLMACGSAAALSTAGVASYQVDGDEITLPLQGLQGDVQRGRAIVVDRRTGLCLLCHQGPFPEEPTPGNLSTNLAGVGGRWTAGQLRMRVVDARRLNPQSVMPSFHRVEGLNRVGAAWKDRPLLNAQQVEDVVAFLVTLR